MRIVICGSMKFAKGMMEIKKKLEEQGHVATVPSNIERYVKSPDAETKREKTELDAIRLYFEKIRSADAVLVVNKDKNNIENYIGGNTLIEMAFAHVLNKKIFLFNPIPRMSYSDEIEAMNLLFLTEI
jgi:predicted RNA-binding protein with PUA domain